ncbi:MAG TPA: tetratricopeptide repeat protein [Polyangia bacterium]|nr:tetratricopeptide repeat protein [Polyangia bacterium]
MSERELDGLEQAAEELLQYCGDPSDLHVEPLDDLARRRLLDRAVDRLGEETATDERRPLTAVRRRVAPLAAAALFLLAAGAGIALLARSPEPETAAGTSAEPGTVADRRMEPGDTVVTIDGSSTLDLPTGIRMAVGPLSRMRLERFDPEEIAVSLDGGEIVAALEAGRSGPPFVVVSPAGRVRVTGTVLRVEVAGDVTVDVLRGSVRVEDGLHDGHVEAGERVVLGVSGAVPIPEGTASAALTAARAGGLLDGVVFPAPGRVLPADDGPPPPSGPVSPEARTTAPAPAAPRPEGGETVEALLFRAGELRVAKDWAGAAAAYREIFERHPDSSQARTSILSLAEIELVHLGRPDSALARFELYLTSWPDGSLAPEAELGRARALGRLGRTAEETAALRAFVSRYPNSLLADRARNRLEALERGAGLP